MINDLDEKKYSANDVIKIVETLMSDMGEDAIAELKAQLSGNGGPKPEPEPEEPQYKAGDWVVDVDNGIVFQLISNDEGHDLRPATIDDFAFEVDEIQVAVCANDNGKIAPAVEHDQGLSYATILCELARLNNKLICPPKVHKGNYRLGGEKCSTR